MSETPSDRQTGINKRGGEQFRSVEANSRTPGSRSLEAGGEFLKALADDLGAVASRLRLLLIAKHMRTRSPPLSARRRIRVFRSLSIALFGLVPVGALALSGFALWVLWSKPVEPRRSDADTLGLQFEARKGKPLGHIGPLRVGGTSQHDLGREPGAQGQPGPDVTVQSIASLGESGSSSTDAGEQKKATKERQTAAEPGVDQPQLVRTETQDSRSASRQLEMSGSLTDTPPRQCNVDLCAARYTSLDAADCTYQPYGGGPRRICELSTRSADAPTQTLLPVPDPRSETEDTKAPERAAEVPKSVMPARAGAQCNVDLCAARYTSFNAPDCTYQPHGGGPRRICER
jgi:hypothetical protein